MNRFRGPAAARQSKATPQTLCQKCLKKDNYECKSSAQDRPYFSRPSRTQQLANPELVPRLASDVPNELLRRTGIADEQLAKKALDRGREQAVDEARYFNERRKRSRSNSSYSSTSISTISTNLSPSPSRDLKIQGSSWSWNREGADKRRRDSTSTSASYLSESSFDAGKIYAHHEHRNIRRRHASRSPAIRGRRKQNDILAKERFNGNDVQGRYRRHSSSCSSYSSTKGILQDRSNDRHPYRKRPSISPDSGGKSKPHGKRSNRRTKSRSVSRDRSRIARKRLSMIPGAPDRENGRNNVLRSSKEPFVKGDRSKFYSSNDRYQRPFNNPGHDDAIPTGKGPHLQSSLRDRSLSPFSKRVALTQAMNMGN